jgi:hypothetical protein
VQRPARDRLDGASTAGGRGTTRGSHR